MKQATVTLAVKAFAVKERRRKKNKKGRTHHGQLGTTTGGQSLQIYVGRFIGRTTAVVSNEISYVMMLVVDGLLSWLGENQKEEAENEWIEKRIRWGDDGLGCTHGPCGSSHAIHLGGKKKPLDCRVVNLCFCFYDLVLGSRLCDESVSRASFFCFVLKGLFYERLLKKKERKKGKVYHAPIPSSSSLDTVVITRNCNEPTSISKIVKTNTNFVSGIVSNARKVHFWRQRCKTEKFCMLYWMAAFTFQPSVSL